MSQGPAAGGLGPRPSMPSGAMMPQSHAKSGMPLAVWIILGAAAIILIVFLALGLPSPAELMRSTEEVMPPPAPTGAADDLPAIERDLGAIGVDNLDAELQDVEKELK